MKVFFHAWVTCCLTFSVFSATSQNPNLYFPPKTGATWQTISPASLGFCQERIDSLYNYLEERHTKSFILLQDGRVVLEKYFGTFTQDSIWYWASAGKSLTAFLVGQAQEEGLLHIDSPTVNYLGAGWTSCTPAQEAAITVRQQLSMTTGLDDTPANTNSPDPNLCTDPLCLQYLAPPGTRWAYHTGAYRLLQDVVAETSGLTINQFTKTRVYDRTGMKGIWLEDIQYGRARDMARYGLLTLAKGIWNGDTLLHDPQYFHAMTHRSQQLNKSYGYLWWLNGQESSMLPGLQSVLPGKLCPNAPDDMIAALGKNDQKIHVVPSKGWVVVRQGESAGYTGPGGGQVPITFDNTLWNYLNQLVCKPTHTSEVPGNQLRIWPNPASEGWNIEVPAPIEWVEVYDSQGHLVRSATGNGTTTCQLEAAGLPTGIFAVKIFVGGNVYQSKVAVNGQ